MNVKDKLVTLEELRTGLDTKVNTSAIVNNLTIPDTTEKTATDTGILTVTDAMAANARDLVVGIEPVQDLHGYDHPWPAGGGKNLVNPENWSNASSNQVTYTVDKEKGTITITGTATANSYAEYDLSNLLPNTAYILTGAPSGSSESSTYNLQVQGLGTTVKDTGSGASFTTGSDVSGLKLRVTVYQGASGGGKVFYPMVRLSSVSDATFAPYSNICPITGWTGVEVTDSTHNLFAGTYLGLVASGTVDPTKGIISSISGVKTALIPIKGGMTYAVQKNGGNRFSVCESAKYPEVGDVVDILYNTQDQSANLSTVVTPSSSAKYLLVYVSNAGDEAPVQVEFGSTVTTYAEGTSTTYPISWQTEAGTVYGGYVDPVTGELTVTHSSVTYDGSEDETWNSGQYGAQAYTFLPSDAVDYISSGALPNLASNILRQVAQGASWDNAGIISRQTNTSNLWVNFDNTGVMTGAEARQYVSQHNLTVVYELATPQTYQLQPTQIALLLGQNNIFADVSGDSGTITLDYLALTGELTKKPLSAEMGNVLNDTKVNVADVVNDLTTGGTTVPLSAEMGKKLAAYSHEVLTATGVTSGTIVLERYGRIRLLSFNDAVVTSSFAMPTLDSSDRPNCLTAGALFTGSGACGQIWVRPAGTFGSEEVAGHTVNGTLVWIANS